MGEIRGMKGERGRTVVITTKLRVSASSHMLRGGRWRQLVVTCLVSTSSAKPRGHMPAHTGPMGFEPGPVLWPSKHFTSWASAAWRLTTHAKEIYISSRYMHITYNFSYLSEFYFL